LETPLPRIPGAPPAARHGRKLHDALGIRIDRDGVWYYHGSPIQRKELVCLLASALRVDDTGGYWLVTPTEMARIDVEDAPFLAVEMYRAGEGRGRFLSLRTNVDEIVTIGTDHPLYVIIDEDSGEPAPYVKLELGREARLSRAVYYELATLAEEAVIDGVRHLGVWSSGTFFPLGPAGDTA
jgi:hypothetical protein